MILEMKVLGTPDEQQLGSSYLSVTLVESVVFFLHVGFSLLQPSDWETEGEKLKLL